MSLIISLSYFWQIIIWKLLFLVSDFVDGSDLYTLWRQEKKLRSETVKLYSAELAITLGKEMCLQITHLTKGMGEGEERFLENFIGLCAVPPVTLILDYSRLIFVIFPAPLFVPRT